MGVTALPQNIFILLCCGQRDAVRAGHVGTEAFQRAIGAQREIA